MAQKEGIGNNLQANQPSQDLNTQKIAEPPAGQAQASNEQKSNLFDADKIRHLGIKNLHTSKREEKTKRKLMRKQNMFDSVQLQNSGLLKNLEM